MPTPDTNQTAPPSGVHPNMLYHEYYGYVYFCAPLCWIGFLTNILCVVVLSQDRSKFSTTFLLQMLAMADNGLLATMFFIRVLPTAANYHPENLDLQAYNQAFLSIFDVCQGLLEVFKMYAVLMIVLVTIDRCIAMFFPLKVIRFCGSPTKTATWQCVALAIYVVVFNMPKFFEFQVSKVNGTTTIGKSGWAQSKLYNEVYYTLDSVLNLILPVVVVFCLNVCLILRLKKASASRKLMTSSEQNGQSGVTVNLVSVASVFLLCEAPIAITTLLLTEDAFPDMNSTILAHAIADCFQVFNSFVNFFIYFLVGQKFRRILREICCIRYQRPRSGSWWSRATATTTTSSKYMKEPAVPMSVITK